MTSRFAWTVIFPSILLLRWSDGFLTPTCDSRPVFRRFLSTDTTSTAAPLLATEDETSCCSKQTYQRRAKIAKLIDLSLLTHQRAEDYEWIQNQLHGLIGVLASQYRQCSMLEEKRDEVDLYVIQLQLNSFMELLGMETSLPLLMDDTDMKLAEAIDSISSRQQQPYFAASTQNSISTTAKTKEQVSSVSSGSPDEDNETEVVRSPPKAPTRGVGNDNDETTEEDVPRADDVNDDSSFDVVIVGGGLGGLCAGAILNTVYGKSVGIFESHYLAGGCAHAFERKTKDQTFVFDSGPTILLGCSSPPFNALRQVLDAVGESVDWIPYSGWGMIENPEKDTEKRWRVDLGPDLFENGPLRTFGGDDAVQEFRLLQTLTKDLVVGADIPAMAMRPGSKAIFPLLKYFGTFVKLILQGEKLTGTFAPFMDGPIYTVKSPWLRDWLDALAFSLSGLEASRTAAAAMAFILNDMHREGAALDYPTGGMGSIVDALVRAVEKGTSGSKVFLRQHVASINFDDSGTRAIGVTLAKSSQTVLGRDGVICNAPIWTLRNLVPNHKALSLLNDGLNLDSETNIPSCWTMTNAGSSLGPRTDITKPTFLNKCDKSEMTGSFIHLHLAIHTEGLDLRSLEAHYTVMDRGLSGDPSKVTNGVSDGPCGETNMIAVSNPCVIDATLAPEGYAVLHAYGAGNEPFEIWEGMDRNSQEYKELKAQRAAPLWRAVESIIPDVRERLVLDLVGSPLTHERFLRRPRGTYGSATEDYLPNGSTPIETLVLANDGVFPGIGVPSVAIAGASAANAFVGVKEQWSALTDLKRKGKLSIRG